MDIDQNEEIQINLLDLLAEFKDQKNRRQRAKSSPFKVLNAIYLITIYNEKKGRQLHYPGKEYIADRAKIDRSLVTKVVTSIDFELYCDVKRAPFRSNEYKLKEWVFQWFRLFYRSGMMKGLQQNYKRWLQDFQKRLRRWLIPALHAGNSLKDIYDAFVNKLSTRNPLKVAAVESLKVAAMNPAGGSTNPYGLKTNTELSDYTVLEFNELHGKMKNRLFLNEGDIRQFTFKNSLGLVKKGVDKLLYRIEKLGWKPISKVRALQKIINDLKAA